MIPGGQQVVRAKGIRTSEARYDQRNPVTLDHVNMPLNLT